MKENKEEFDFKAFAKHAFFAFSQESGYS